MKYVIQNLAFECQPFAIANHRQLEVCICTTGEFWIIKQVKLKAINFEINCNTLDDDYFFALHIHREEKECSTEHRQESDLSSAFQWYQTISDFCFRYVQLLITKMPPRKVEITYLTTQLTSK